MLRSLLTVVLALLVGILVGEIPVDKSTIGRTAWELARKGIDWSSGKFQTFVTHAEIGDKTVTKWLGKSAGSVVKQKAPPKKLEEEDPEGLTLSDKEALRKILE